MRAPRDVRVGSVVIGSGLIACAIAIPAAGDYTLYVLALVVIHAIAIVSLNVLMGYAGQVSLGHAAVVGIGAYATGEVARAGAPYPLALLAGPLFAAIASVIVGLPSLRIRGFQVAATTLAFGVTAERLLFARPWSAGSGTALSVPRPAIVEDGRAFLLLALLGLGLVLLADRSIRMSRFGRAFLAVRDREDTAAARGIHVGRTKLTAYAFSGALAGVAGALFASLLEQVSAASFTIWTSLGYVAAVVVGGLGSWMGAVIVGATFAGLPELLRPAAGWSPLAGAALLAVVPWLRPDGLGVLFDRRIGRREPGSVPPWGEGAAADQPVERRALALAMPVWTVLRVADVAVAFGGVAALQGVSLEVRRGSITGVIGPNGAGKTTLFDCISGSLTPDRGAITYRGRDLLAVPEHGRASLGIARTFQNVGLCATRTVGENILIAQHERARYGLIEAFARTPRMRRTERALEARARRVMAATGTLGIAGEVLSSLSHGQQRLVEVAAALAADPSLVLLDEPFAGLDHAESEDLAVRLREIRERLRLTIVVIEHDVPLVAALCDDVYVLADGAVLAHGAPADVQRDPDVIRVYLGERLPLEEVVLGA